MIKHITAAVAALIGAGVMATPAHATETIWDKVATCESTNDWDINTGNSFYGGLQFTKSTWNEFGGQEFADRADHATREEQITVAQRVLAVQGPGAWPVCSKYAGLTKANGGAAGYVPKRAKPAEPAAKDAPTPKRATPAVPAAKASAEYEVKAGDTLIQIARDHGLGENWHALYVLNQDEIEDPDLIYVGQHFILE